MSEEAFEEVEPLGKGGFARTFLVNVVDEYVRADFGVSKCVIKVPLDKQKEQVLKHELEKNFFVHMQLKDLKSVNIVRYLGFAVFEGKIVMAMEYVPDGDLREKVGSIDYQRRLPLDEALDITEGILEALVLIHGLNMIHRDIKPENIMFEGRVPKLCDLGVARFMKAEELAYSVTGTPPYLPPEIYEEKGATFSCDIWSVGICLYEMLTGQLPFGGRTVLAMHIKELERLICQAQYEEPHKIYPDIPREISALIAKALQKDPSRRFQSATEMLKALRRYRQATKDPVGAEIAAIREQMGVPGQTAAVETRLRGLIRLFPEDARIYQNLGELYNRCQRYPAAIDAFKKGIELAPEDVNLYWHLFLSYQGTRMPRKADDALAKATQLGLDEKRQRRGETLLAALNRGKSND